MTDDYKLVTGAWMEAIGTIISALAETRELVGITEFNNRIVAVGKGLQAVGSMLIGTVETDDPLNFAGNWIDGAGAAGSSIASYLKYLEPENREANIRLEILGDSFQSMGASISALADHLAGEEALALGNAAQGLGAGLEAIGANYRLKDRREEGQSLITIGAIIQAIGANSNAIVITRQLIDTES
ncbi:MAG: DUF6944 family repetitive protein [Anaerobacillus sp.]|uniref:DUF6944 family repetitive protein n=1 Tax=Anaerobacillus sp. TaxID=1872506 RepID=UPI00391B2CE0